MTADEIRTKYLKFYEARGHAIIPSASLVPANDPTTLFTGSGMQPLVPYLLGKDHPEGTRLVDSQKSFRSGDIEEVGDNRHTTFFEMLGNWSLGDYFKQEQLPWVFAFLTEEVGLDPRKIYVTAFIGDEKNKIPKDTESEMIWKKLFTEKGIDAEAIEIGSEENGYEVGMQGGRIFYYDAKKNWWSRAGVPEKMPAGEPGGPDSEIFYDFGTKHDPKWGKECHPNCDCGRFLEIGNSVFMQYIKNEDGTFSLLPKQNVDFGGGLERVAAASNNDPDVFNIDIFWDIIGVIEKLSGKRYKEEKYVRAFRIVSDHIRAAVFLIVDGVLPSNTDQGYFVRRLLRRAIRFGDQLGIPENELATIAESVISVYGDTYFIPDIHLSLIKNVVHEEEVRFRQTLKQGLREFEKLSKGDQISGQDAYVLFTTHGFPIELTEEIATERGAKVDMDAFREAMNKHREDSRAGSEQKFKGGLADSSEATTRLHTAHHLLLKALQVVLGDHVHQRGSNITAERLRIDFSHDEKMTPEQIKRVEDIVNEKIQEGIPMIRSVLPKEEAEKLGAEHEFGAKYPDTVSVYSLGPIDATEENPKFTEAFSIEFCGGPHVHNTKELSESGVFKIQKEEAVASGVRRIKAVLTK